MEISGRAIIDWASKSGMIRQGPKSSNDEPDMKFGIPHMDDGSIGRVLTSLCGMECRSFIVPELRSNLVAAERRQNLSKFPSDGFRRVAKVIMGEPDSAYKG